MRLQEESWTQKDQFIDNCMIPNGAIWESESDSNSKEGQEEADTRCGGLDLKDSWPIGYDDKQMLMVHFDW